MFLKKPAEGKGGGENAIRRPKRQKPIRVDNLESYVNLPSRRLDGTRKEETRIIVCDDHGGFGCQLRQQAFTGSGFRFEIGIVKDWAFFEGPSIVLHSIDHETVKPIAGPRISGAKTL
jgi:hypothetical protein